jgi:hypothetical protein
MGAARRVHGRLFILLVLGSADRNDAKKKEANFAVHNLSTL